MADDERFLIVTTMKNEGPFMIDWIAYHRAIGFDDVVIYTNDCSDGTDAIGDRLTELGYAHHHRNRLGPRATPQNRAHNLSMRLDVFQQADWVMSLDVDEYVNLRLPEGNIRALVKACGSADAISICWKMFGYSGNDTFEDKPVPEAFFMATEENKFPNYKTQAFKTLFRNNGVFARFKAHRPHVNVEAAQDPEAPYANVVWSDAGGRAMDASKIGWRIWRGFSHEHARVHHYAVRSIDSFLVKRDRGRTNHVGQDQGLEYWKDLNHNHVEDRSILRHMPAMETIKDEMLQDPELRRLHDAACTWHKAKADELRAREDWAGFVDELKSNGGVG